MLWILSAVVVGFSLTYALFVMVMRGKTAWPALHPVGKALLAPWAVLGLLLDVIWVNWCIGTVLFVQVPTQFTFTSRLGSNEKLAGGGLNGWRRTCAHWICRELLEPFDPGHC